MDWIKIFTENGVPMIILGFLLWFIIKPIGDSLVKNINKQTELLDKLLDACNQSHNRIDNIQDDVHEIKNQLKNIVKIN